MADEILNKTRDQGQPLDAAQLEGRLLAYSEDLARYIESRMPPALRGRVTVDDLVQDVWVAAFRFRETFRDDGDDSFIRWLFAIAKNKILDRIKHERRGIRGREVGAAQINRGPGSASLYNVFGALASSQKSPIRDAASGEAAKVLEAAIVGLPPDRSRAVRRRYIDERPLSEIAQEMGKSVAAVRGLLYHGLQELRQVMGRSGNYFTDTNSNSRP